MSETVAPVERLTARELGAGLGAGATLVEIASAFCQPCRAARLVLEHAASTEPGVRVVVLDVADHLALGERLRVLSTPTVLVLDARGAVRHRMTGVPRLAQVRAVLADVLGSATAPGP